MTNRYIHRVVSSVVSIYRSNEIFMKATVKKGDKARVYRRLLDGSKLSVYYIKSISVHTTSLSLEKTRIPLGY